MLAFRGWLSVNRQTRHWTGSFGNSYIERNPKTVSESDNMYKKNFGVTRTELNKEFLSSLPKGIKILEVGTSVGVQLKALQNLGFSNLFGIDVSEKAVKEFRKANPEMSVLLASAFDIPFKDRWFDLVFTSGVLIHISENDLAKALDEIFRVSKKHIWGWEYFSTKRKEVLYRGHNGFLWNDNYCQRYLDRFEDLKLVRRKTFGYIGSENEDQMFLLKKEGGK